MGWFTSSKSSAPAPHRVVVQQAHGTKKVTLVAYDPSTGVVVLVHDNQDYLTVLGLDGASFDVSLSGRGNHNPHWEEILFLGSGTNLLVLRSRVTIVVLDYASGEELNCFSSKVGCGPETVADYTAATVIPGLPFLFIGRADGFITCLNWAQQQWTTFSVSAAELRTGAALPPPSTTEGGPGGDQVAAMLQSVRCLEVFPCDPNAMLVSTAAQGLIKFYLQERRSSAIFLLPNSPSGGIGVVTHAQATEGGAYVVGATDRGHVFIWKEKDKKSDRTTMHRWWVTQESPLSDAQLMKQYGGETSEAQLGVVGLTLLGKFEGGGGNNQPLVTSADELILQVHIAVIPSPVLAHSSSSSTLVGARSDVAQRELHLNIKSKKMTRHARFVAALGGGTPVPGLSTLVPIHTNPWPSLRHPPLQLLGISTNHQEPILLEVASSDREEIFLLSNPTPLRPTAAWGALELAGGSGGSSGGAGADSLCGPTMLRQPQPSSSSPSNNNHRAIVQSLLIPQRNPRLLGIARTPSESLWPMTLGPTANKGSPTTAAASVTPVGESPFCMYELKEENMERPYALITLTQPQEQQQQNGAPAELTLGMCKVNPGTHQLARGGGGLLEEMKYQPLLKLVPCCSGMVLVGLSDAPSTSPCVLFVFDVVTLSCQKVVIPDCPGRVIDILLMEDSATSSHGRPSGSGNPHRGVIAALRTECHSISFYDLGTRELLPQGVPSMLLPQSAIITHMAAFQAPTAVPALPPGGAAPGSRSTQGAVQIATVLKWYLACHLMVPNPKKGSSVGPLLQKLVLIDVSTGGITQCKDVEKDHQKSGHCEGLTTWQAGPTTHGQVERLNHALNPDVSKPFLYNDPSMTATAGGVDVGESGGGADSGVLKFNAQWTQPISVHFALGFEMLLTQRIPLVAVAPLGYSGGVQFQIDASNSVDVAEIHRFQLIGALNVPVLTIALGVLTVSKPNSPAASALYVKLIGQRTHVVPGGGGGGESSETTSLFPETPWTLVNGGDEETAGVLCDTNKEEAAVAAGVGSPPVKPKEEEVVELSLTGDLDTGDLSDEADEAEAAPPTSASTHRKELVVEAIVNYVAGIHIVRDISTGSLELKRMILNGALNQAAETTPLDLLREQCELDNLMNFDTGCFVPKNSDATFEHGVLLKTILWISSATSTGGDSLSKALDWVAKSRAAKSKSSASYDCGVASTAHFGFVTEDGLERFQCVLGGPVLGGATIMGNHVGSGGAPVAGGGGSGNSLATPIRADYSNHQAVCLIANYGGGKLVTYSIEQLGISATSLTSSSSSPNLPTTAVLDLRASLSSNFPLANPKIFPKTAVIEDILPVDLSGGGDPSGSPAVLVLTSKPWNLFLLSLPGLDCALCYDLSMLLGLGHSGSPQQPEVPSPNTSMRTGARISCFWISHQLHVYIQWVPNSFAAPSSQQQTVGGPTFAGTGVEVEHLVLERCTADERSENRPAFPGGWLESPQRRWFCYKTGYDAAPQRNLLKGSSTAGGIGAGVGGSYRQSITHADLGIKSDANVDLQTLSKKMLEHLPPAPNAGASKQVGFFKSFVTSSFTDTAKKLCTHPSLATCKKTENFDDFAARLSRNPNLSEMERAELLGPGGGRGGGGGPGGQQAGMAGIKDGMHDTKNLMNENLQALHERGDRIKRMEQKTGWMEEDAAEFEQLTKKLKEKERKSWF